MYKSDKLKNIVVIIPVYNCKQYLKDCIASVVNQQYDNINIVLVNDGSTDGSAELCDKLEKMHTQIHVIHKENGGVSSARNMGIEYAQKIFEEDSYIAFLDADDAWEKDFFSQEIIELMEMDYDLIGFQSIICNNDMSRCKMPESIEEKRYIGGGKSVWIYPGQHFGAMLYNLKLLKRYGIRFKKLSYSEDKIFMMSCLYLAENIYLKPKTLYWYRINKFSAIHNRKYGIEYFAPFILEYYNWDFEMDSLKKETPMIQEGRKLARLYLDEMKEEHFMTGGTLDSLIDFYNKNPMYLKISKDDMDTKKIGKNVFREKAKISTIRVIQLRIKWKIRYILKTILSIDILNKALEHKKYPILMEK